MRHSACFRRPPGRCRGGQQRRTWVLLRLLRRPHQRSCCRPAVMEITPCPCYPRLARRRLPAAPFRMATREGAWGHHAAAAYLPQEELLLVLLLDLLGEVLLDEVLGGLRRGRGGSGGGGGVSVGGLGGERVKGRREPVERGSSAGQGREVRREESSICSRGTTGTDSIPSVLP